MGKTRNKFSNRRKFANTYEFENSHRTCESHFMQISSHNLHRQKALTFVQISVETLQNFRKGYTYIIRCI
jgi:hypothetical protein